jgi:hypothetical protein
LVRIGLFDRWSPRWSVYDEGPTNPTLLGRESDEATSRPVHDLIDLLVTFVDACQVLAPDRFHKT